MLDDCRRMDAFERYMTLYLYIYRGHVVRDAGRFGSYRRSSLSWQVEVLPGSGPIGKTVQFCAVHISTLTVINFRPLHLSFRTSLEPHVPQPAGGISSLATGSLPSTHNPLAAGIA